MTPSQTISMPQVTDLLVHNGYDLAQPTPIGETAARLAELSNKAQENGERDALTSA